MTSYKKMITYFWSLSFGFFQLITFNSLRTIHLILRSMPEIFDILILRVSLWHFRHHTFQYKSFFLFLSQILVCATVFAAHYLFSRFDIGWVITQKHERVGRYIGTSRAVHGLGRVGFRPNPDSTCRHRVEGWSNLKPTAKKISWFGFLWWLASVGLGQLSKLKKALKSGKEALLEFGIFAKNWKVSS